MNELFQIFGCSTIHEVFNNIKKSQLEKKFCNKVMKIVRDIQGRDMTIKSGWRWIRGIIQDFAKVKQISVNQANLLKKIDLFMKENNIIVPLFNQQQNSQN